MQNLTKCDPFIEAENAPQVFQCFFFFFQKQINHIYQQNKRTASRLTYLGENWERNREGGKKTKNFVSGKYSPNKMW